MAQDNARQAVALRHDRARTFLNDDSLELARDFEHRYRQRGVDTSGYSDVDTIQVSGAYVCGNPLDTPCTPFLAPMRPRFVYF